LTGHDEQDFEYDIALSFAGEDRERAEALAAKLKSSGIKVFYDRYETAQLWGRDLYQHLQEVYRDKAQFCVIFVSDAYARKLWTRHELKQAQARAFREHGEYILPLRLDDTEIPGLNATIGYVDLRSVGVDEIHQLILRKLFGDAADEKDPHELTWKGELVEFRGMEVATFWPAKLENSQRIGSYSVTRELARIRYGEEPDDWGAERGPCHDCGAVKGEFHVPGCDVERCPACGEQAITCDCEKTWNE
jgi:hypothetical protein